MLALHCMRRAQPPGARLRIGALLGFDTGVYKRLLEEAAAAASDDLPAFLTIVNEQDSVSTTCTLLIS